MMSAVSQLHQLQNNNEQYFEDFDESPIQNGEIPIVGLF